MPGKFSQNNSKMPVDERAIKLKNLKYSHKLPS